AHRCRNLPILYLQSTPSEAAIMGFLWTLIIGLVVGAIAKLIMPGRDPGGIIVTMLIGVAGALLAGFLGRALGWYNNPGEGPGIIASIVGALLLLLLYRLFTGRRGSTTVP
ncbi:MAG: GlsB/YeaQ/YmgE family stress response membrane protein, partial [Gemmatimonadales bacterium]